MPQPTRLRRSDRRRPSLPASRYQLLFVAVLLGLALAVPAMTAAATTTPLGDGFESGTLGAWSVGLGGDGQARVVTSPVRRGSHAARLTGSTNPGSAASLRIALPTPQPTVTVALDLRVGREGRAHSNVPIVKLFAADGTRIVTLYRQNATRGQVWLQDRSGYHRTTGSIALGAWVRISLIVTTGSAGRTTGTVTVNGARIHSRALHLGTASPAVVQLGNEVGGQAFDETIDRVSIIAPATTSAPSPTPLPAIAPTPAPSGSGWRVVIDDRYAALTDVPGHWSRYSSRYGSSPQNCASPSHAYVANGLLTLRMAHEWSGSCGAGWYTGGLRLATSYASVDQRITITFRVAANGVSSHYNLPLRWPTSAPWPSGGEENYCEWDSMGDCTTFLHYSNDPTVQVHHGMSIGTGAWHTVRAERRNHVVRIWVDDMTTPRWTYTGTSTTLPDTLKTVVLQQECRVGGCPSGTSGGEEIQISRITVENPE